MAVARLKGAIRLGLLLLSVVVLGITIVLSVASATGAMQSPPPPTNVTATVYNEKITVSWTPAGGYSAYFAYRAVNGGSFTYYGYFSSVSSFDDISISPGNTYSYYLLTYHPSGNSVPSNSASGPYAIATPGGPTLTLTSSTAGTLNWGTVSNATRYWVKRYTNGGSPSTTEVYTNSMSLSGLNLSNEYTWEIQARNARGGGDWSSPVVSDGITDVVAYPPYTAACPTSDCKAASPISGGSLLSSAREGTPADPVNLATGAEHYEPGPDLVVYNPTGPAAIFQRSFFSELAAKGIYSPGLSAGWAHNWDVSIRKQHQNGVWGNLALVFPNGSAEVLAPVMSGGTPTGDFTEPTGAQYVVTGTPSGTTGVWDSIEVFWKDETLWVFDTVKTNYYVLSQVENSLGLGLVLNWDSNRRLTQISDLDSTDLLLECSYNSEGLLDEVADLYNRSVYFAWETTSGVGSKTLAAISQVVTSGTSNPAILASYDHSVVNSRAHLHKIRVPSPTGTGEATTTINYDPSSGKVTSTVDGNGNKLVYTYSSGATLVQVQNSSSSTAISWTQNFDGQNRNTGITDADSNSTTVSYTDSNNPRLPTSIVDRMARETEFTYDSYGNVLTVTSPRSVTTTYSYGYSVNPMGRLSSVQVASRTPVSFTYTTEGLVSTITGPSPTGSGTVTVTNTYDALGNVLTVTGPGNNASSTRTITLEYEVDGAYSQDAMIGQPILVQDELGNELHLRYDSQGRLTSAENALGNSVSTSYNIVGQMLSTVLPATNQHGIGNTTISNVYQYAGGPLSYTSIFDESAVEFRRTTYSYGHEGELLGVSGNNEPATYEYDAAYRLKKLTNAAGAETTYSYNSLGLPSTVTLPGSDQHQYTSYDDGGSLLTRLNGRGQTINYEYDDPEGRLTAVTYPSNSALDIEYTYDTYGRLIGVDDATGATSYSYNDLDMITSIQTTFTGLSAKTIGYSYYADGSRAGMSTPAGNFSYLYDAAGRPTSMINPDSETTAWVHDAAGRLTKQTLDNGVYTDYFYNALDQLTALENRKANTDLLSAYTDMLYDASGNLLEAVSNITGVSAYSGTYTFEYDGADRLIEEDGPAGTNSFAYDLAGNATTFRGASRTFNSDDQLTVSGYSYDDDGNPTTYNSVSHTFDPENRLTAVGSWSAGYNAAGLQAWREISATRTYTLYDGIMPAVELDATGNVSALNTFGPYGLASRDGNMYTFDWRGGTSQQLDGSASLLNTFKHDAFGNSTSTSSSSDPLANFAGQYGYFRDGSSMLRLGLRHYSDTTGLFLTRDPIGYQGGINLYAYTLNNPILSIDPSGLQSQGKKDFWDHLSSFSAGFGNAVSFGLMDHYYRNAGLMDTFDKSSAAYFGGQATGLVTQSVLGGAAVKSGVTLYKLKAAEAAARARLLDNAARGAEFEKCVLSSLNLTKNTKRFSGVTTAGTPYVTIPESVAGGVITEVKNVAYQSFSKQLQAQFSLGMPVNLIVGPSSKVSKPLFEAIKNSGGKILRYDKATGAFSPYP